MIKLIIGPEPTVTYRVPKSTIKYCWGGGEFADKLKGIERPSSSGADKPKSSSASARSNKDNGSKGKASEDKASKGKGGKLSTPKKVLQFVVSPSKKGKEKERVPEIADIKLPDDDPATWSAFLYWSGTPKGDLLDVVVCGDHRLVRCWNFAMKYGLLDFADAVMIALIAGFDGLESGGPRGPTYAAVQEAFCTDKWDTNKMKTLMCEEILKTLPEDTECQAVGKGHDPYQCKDCKQDVRGYTRLTCLRKANNPHKCKDCPLEQEVYKQVLEKKVEVAPRHRHKFYDRLVTSSQGGYGGFPMYMKFLLSENWKDVKKAFDDPRRAPDRLTEANFGYRPRKVVATQLGVLPDPS